MKVSRKVGRRSRKHTSSSVSRRRLRNKNRKHTKTQKGGKYVKRGRGHKRARTYKHGKRFHKGGRNWPIFGVPNPAIFNAKEKKITDLKYILVIDSKEEKKKLDTFSINITKQVDKTGITMYSVTFEKIEGDSKFSFRFGPFVDLETLANEVSNAINNGGVFENMNPKIPNVTYMFMADSKLAIQIYDYISYYEGPSINN